MMNTEMGSVMPEAGGQYTPDPAYAAPPTFASTPGATPKFEELKTDEDLPF